MNVAHHSKALTRYMLPYCLHKCKNGKWIILNRKYKPLGVFSDGWVIYGLHPSAFELKTKMNEAVLKKISYNGEVVCEDDGTVHVWLYCDVIQSWKEYMNRVRVLMSRIVEA